MSNKTIALYLIEEVKIKYTTTGNISKGNEISILKRNLHSRVHIHDSQDVETTKVSVHRRMDNENVYIYTYTPEWFSHKKDGNPAICDNIDDPGGHYAKWNKPDEER